MRLQELVHLCHFEVFYHELVKHYDEMSEDQLEDIKQGFHDLKHLEINEPKKLFEIQVQKVEYEGEISIDVSGIAEGEDLLYSLVFTDWKDFLAYPLNMSIFEDMMPEEALAHIYWEMSWGGLTYSEAYENSMKEEVEEAFRISMVAFIRALKEKEFITREDLEQFILSYKISESYTTRMVLETALEDLIQERILAEDVMEYLIESIDEDEFVRAIKERRRYES